ncbi:hypothetical protein [Erythrobacter ani]|uniref:Uncharacterized protein n=1 Tax=Erythrobacter ani TaxID=2827235 RepID=A0ABS6SLR1_9SPHN|nr:hypothetical protein [Erythrobacter ani]MBV7265999.1 hypothetical protein [Erythrobacter ani]
MGQLSEEQKQVARDEGERWWNSAHDRLRFSVEYAQAGIKSLFLANGGGIVSLLTFAGNTKAIVEPDALFWSFIWFGIGCFAALVIYIAGYESQGYVMQAEYERSRQALSDSLELERVFDPSPHEHKSHRAERLGFVAALVSLSMFLLGALVGLDAIT